MTKMTLDRLSQKFDDYIEYSKEKLESIERQAKLTNGRVTKSEMKINALETINCEHDKYKGNNKDWISIAIAAGSMIISITVLIVTFL